MYNMNDMNISKEDRQSHLKKMERLQQINFSLVSDADDAKDF